MIQKCDNQLADLVHGQPFHLFRCEQYTWVVIKWGFGANYNFKAFHGFSVGCKRLHRYTFVSFSYKVTNVRVKWQVICVSKDMSSSDLAVIGCESDGDGLRYLLTRREAMLRRVLGNSLIRLHGAFWTAFTRPAITPPKVNRFGWNLENCQPNVGGWPRRTLGAIRAVATVWEGAEKCFLSGK